VINEPDKWEEQMWTIPSKCLVLRRNKEEWYLINFMGNIHIQVERSTAERLAIVCSDIHQEEDWIYRRSLQFRWLRFWYRRKKKREAKQSGA